MKHIKKVALVVGLVAILAVIAGPKLMKVVLAEDTTNEKEANRGIVTELMMVQASTLSKDLFFLGTLESEATSTLSPKITAAVLSTHVTEGQRVKQGNLLVTLDQESLAAKKSIMLAQRQTLSYQISYLSSEVGSFYSDSPMIYKLSSLKDSLEFQKQEYESAQLLYEAGAISELALDQAALQINTMTYQAQELEATLNSTYDQLKNEQQTALSKRNEIDAAIRELELTLSEAEIRAPYDGIVRQLHVAAGDLAAPGKPVVTLDKDGVSKVVLQVGETDLIQLKSGMNAELTFSGNEAIQYGIVNSVSPSIHPVTRIGQVEISVDELTLEAPVGASVQVRVVLEEEENQVMIPLEAVKSLNTQDVVYVSEDGLRVVEREVTIGKKQNESYQILEGLEPGDVIAVDNLDALYDGAAIYNFSGSTEVGADAELDLEVRP
ncbi:MAG: efflux RND transporter periplasmic adaptor subunit [Acidaminobacter sp.]|uniref:efflux RND transporter periplasmic adaptor subunit n=1 Tax=Acidaminobacter sp. TaxID=1872102 RepID=UPI001381F491|nr:efflux RND transporter periplasmic adaptor subunit [Acidaminobacter sp.]MZQ96772.1 efflux RND transporter periplasmic adaptor subunit [Acidaminobacter sp.]